MDSNSKWLKGTGSNLVSRGGSPVDVVLDSILVCTLVTIAVLAVGYGELFGDSVLIEVSTKMWGWNVGMVSSLSISPFSGAVELALRIGLELAGITVTVVAVCPLSGQGFEQIGVVELTNDISNSAKLEL